jgi:hypothetical protein
MTLTARMLQILRLAEAGVPLRRGSYGIRLATEELPTAVKESTLRELLDRELLAWDAEGQRYRITDPGRDRILVADRVRDYANSLHDQET